MFSVENGRHAIQRACARAFFECDNTSFEINRTDLRLIENEHGTTTARGHRCMYSRLTTGTRLREKTGLMALPEEEDGQYRSHCPMSKMDSLDAARV
ncbi:MAG: hypothetical protein AB2610_06140 [Candidatus Thiodiazotropha sp.]